MRDTINNTPENTIKKAKRIALTMIFCVPLVVVFGYLTRNVITNNVVTIICFMAIFGVVVLIEELLYNRHQKKIEEKRKTNKSKDVFK